MIDEKEYRKQLESSFRRIEDAFSEVDPDIAECEHAFGTLSITLSDRTKCILSAQPSVRQLWLALAARGTAYHFNWDPQTGKWLDDKGRNIELISFLRGYFKEVVGLDLVKLG